MKIHVLFQGLSKRFWLRERAFFSACQYHWMLASEI